MGLGFYYCEYCYIYYIFFHILIGLHMTFELRAKPVTDVAPAANGYVAARVNRHFG